MGLPEIFLILLMLLLLLVVLSPLLFFANKRIKKWCIEENSRQVLGITSLPFIIFLFLTFGGALLLSLVMKAAGVLFVLIMFGVFLLTDKFKRYFILPNDDETNILQNEGNQDDEEMDISCATCDSPITINSTEIREKKYFCPECKTENSL